MPPTQQPPTQQRCSTSGLVDAHRLSPPRYCNHFGRAECERYFTPRGVCVWSTRGGGACVSDSACTQRIRSPTGTSYIFFKFHKVGSSTVSGTLHRALIATSGNVYCSCLSVSKLKNKTAAERARYTLCSLCSKHDNSLPLLPFFREPAILSLSPAHRLSALFDNPSAAAVLDRTCPQRASRGNVLRTGTVFRLPIDRLISKYFFLRTYCQEVAAREGATSCAAIELDLLPWVFHSAKKTAVGAMVGASGWKATHEVLAHLGDGDSTERSLERAKRTVDAMDVVGITERMDETIVLFSERWQLPLSQLRQAYVSLLVNPTKKPVNESVRAAIGAHAGVARETQLYEYAARRFERDMSKVPDRLAKVASVHAAYLAKPFSPRAGPSPKGRAQAPVV
jgi:hypothetical protein